jgi:hypothetical protein
MRGGMTTEGESRSSSPATGSALSRSRDDGEARGLGARGQTATLAGICGGRAAPSVTSRHFHDNLIGSNFRKLIL